MVGSGDARVLVDALFNEAKTGRRVPEPGTIEAMVMGAALFDNVDLVLVTHEDADHFNAALTVRYLEARSEPSLVTPVDAVEAMRTVASDRSTIEPRITS